MKAFLITAGLLIFTLIISCEGEKVAPIESPVDPCINTDYAYGKNVKAIMDNNCATSGCHDGKSSLRDLSSYDAVYKSRYVIQKGIRAGLSTLNANASLTRTEERIFLCWVENEAPE